MVQTTPAPFFRVFLALILGLLLAAPSVAQNAPGRSDQAPGQEKDDDDGPDVFVEKEPLQPQLTRITHVFKKAKPGGSSCTCDSPEGTDYSLLAGKWSLPSFSYKVYAANSELGAAVEGFVRDAFQAWKTAEDAAPTPTLTETDVVSPPPAIALDGVQAITWQSLRRYGRRTLAVTVYWTDAGNNIVHFDMAFSTSVKWGFLPAESCGGSGDTYDVQNVATHEAGHVFGLGHSNGCNLTMNPTAKVGETIKASLAAGDINGIRAKY